MSEGEPTLIDRLGELCAVLKDNREAEVKALDDFLNYLYQNATAKYDVHKIRWDSVEGPRGPYERANEDTLELNNLIKDLIAHDGRLTINGFFYWKFDNVNVVGRKRA